MHFSSLALIVIIHHDNIWQRLVRSQCAETPGKGLYLKNYKIPRVNQTEKTEIDEFPASNSKNMENQASYSQPFFFFLSAHTGQI